MSEIPMLFCTFQRQDSDKTAGFESFSQVSISGLTLITGFQFQVGLHVTKLM